MKSLTPADTILEQQYHAKKNLNNNIFGFFKWWMSCIPKLKVLGHFSFLLFEVLDVFYNSFYNNAMFFF